MANIHHTVCYLDGLLVLFFFFKNLLLHLKSGLCCTEAFVPTRSSSRVLTKRCHVLTVYMGSQGWEMPL